MQFDAGFFLDKGELLHDRSADICFCAGHVGGLLHLIGEFGRLLGEQLVERLWRRHFRFPVAKVDISVHEPAQAHKERRVHCPRHEAG